MPEQALYLKWRPATFDDVVGQEHITKTLRNSLKSGRIRHAYLFSGPRGTGKTTTARLLSKAVNCADPDPDKRPCNVCHACVAVNEGRYLDLIEIDAATHTGVDDVRDLRDKIAFSPGEGRYKVYIIDEVHRFTGNAFDALLKTLEEPPDHAIFVLATTEIDKVPATIKSRCLQFEFRRLSLREVADRLALIADSEGLKYEMAALELVARYGTGSARDSISLLDQIVSDPHDIISVELVQQVLGLANRRAVQEVVDAIVRQDTGRGLHIINAAIDAGSDPKQFAQGVVEALRAILLAQTASADLIEASEEERRWYEMQAQQIGRAALLQALRAFNEAVNQSASSGWQPQLALELALVDSAHFAPSEPQEAPEYRPTAGGRGAKSSQPDFMAESARPEVTAPGAPPIVPLQAVKEKWLDAQRLIAEHNTSIASLMDHAMVYAVDGNRVIAKVKSTFHLNKLNDPQRVRWIERALLRVMNVELRVQFVLGGGDTPAKDRALDYDDPVIAEGLELGGQILDDEENL